ncbi:MAG: hypothetical protein M1835_006900 [Candelina submexicana]|nr:MAG: hypothetical protein M1835_006900 [Candelina submexicana]
MAKSSRSSSKKANKSRLRSRVFRPIEDQRIDRSSSKLLHLASQPKPTKMDTMKMDVEQQNYEQHEAGEAHKAKQTEGKPHLSMSILLKTVDAEHFAFILPNASIMHRSSLRLLYTYCDKRHGYRWSLYAGVIYFEVNPIQGQMQIVGEGTKAQAAAKVERVHGLPEL